MLKLSSSRRASPGGCNQIATIDRLERSMSWAAAAAPRSAAGHRRTIGNGDLRSLACEITAMADDFALISINFSFRSASDRSIGGLCIAGIRESLPTGTQSSSAYASPAGRPMSGATMRWRRRWEAAFARGAPASCGPARRPAPGSIRQSARGSGRGQRGRDRPTPPTIDIRLVRHKGARATRRLPNSAKDRAAAWRGQPFEEPDSPLSGGASPTCERRPSRQRHRAFVRRAFDAIRATGAQWRPQIRRCSALGEHRRSPIGCGAEKRCFRDRSALPRMPD